MVPKSSDKKIAAILKDTITLLCKNSIAFKRKCTIEAVVGITVDDNNVILVSMSELVRVASSNCELAAEKKDSSDSRNSTQEDSDNQAKLRAVKQEDDELDLEISVTDSPGMGQEGMQDNEVLDLDISVTDSPGVPETALELSDEESKSSTDLVFVKQEVVDHSWTGSSGNNHRNEVKERSVKDRIKVQPACDFVVQPISLQQQQQQQQEPPQPQQHWPIANYSLPVSQQPTMEATTNSSTNKNLKTVQKKLGRKRQKQQKQQQPQEQQQIQQQEQHQRELLKGPKSKQFKCKYCQKCFAGKWYLEMHEKTHRGIYPFTCSICSKGVLTTGHLRMHLSRHKRETKQNVDQTETAASSGSATSEQAFSPIIVDVVSQSLLDKT